jgi:hypothetical protein
LEYYKEHTPACPPDMLSCYNEIFFLLGQWTSKEVYLIIRQRCYSEAVLTLKVSLFTAEDHMKFKRNER